MIKLFLAPLTALLLAACASPQIARHPDQIVTWDQAEGHAYPPPYVAQFQKQDMRVRYIAAEHVTDVKSSTVQLIRQEFDQAGPRAVLIEGPAWAQGLNPASVIERAKTLQKGDFIGAEGYFAVLSCVAHGIPFRGGEPGDKDVLAAVREEGYTAQDLLGTYIVREVPAHVRAQELNLHNPEPDLEKFLKGDCRDLGLTGLACMDLAAFKAWYLRTNGKEFDVHVRIEESAPFPHGPLPSQKISAVINRVRDQFIVERIAALAREYRDVLVIYGADHFPTEVPALRSEFGEPVYRRIR